MCIAMQCVFQCALRFSAYLPNVHSSAYLPNVHPNSVRIFQMCTPTQCISSKCALQLTVYLPNVHSNSLHTFHICTPTLSISSKYAILCTAHHQNTELPFTGKNKHYCHCDVFTLRAKSSYPDICQVCISWRKKFNSSIFFSCKIWCNANCNLITILPQEVWKLNNLPSTQQLACDFMI